MDIFVAKLGSDVTEDNLKDLFKKYGTVGSVNVILDKITKQPKGIAFVNMYDSMEAQNAIEALNQTEFMGHLIVVKAARPREDSEFPRQDNGRNPRNRFYNNNASKSFENRHRVYNNRTEYTSESQDTEEWHADKPSVKNRFENKKIQFRDNRRKGEDRSSERRKESERRRDSDFRKGRSGNERGRRMGEKRPSKRVRLDFNDGDLMNDDF